MLPDNKRQELDVIVQEMLKNKESDFNIRFVVDDFKEKYSVQEAAQTRKPGLIGGIKSAWNARVAGTHEARNSNQAGASKVLQAVGNAAGFVGDVTMEGVKAVTPDFVENAVSGGIQKVAQTAPAQKVIGGISEWARVHPEAAKNLQAVVDIASLVPVAKGVQVGAKVAKTATKGVTTKFAGQVEKRALQSGLKDVEKATELVMEKAKKQNVISAAMEGRATQSGKVKSFDILPSSRDTEIARDVLSVSKPGKNVAETLADINKAIPDISEKEVRPYLRANPRAFNLKTLNSRLNSIEMPDLFKTDASLEKTYNLIRQRMIQQVAKRPKTSEGLWDARKDFDRIVKDQFGDAAFDSEKNTAIKRAVQDMRREVNGFIGDHIGDGTFNSQMRKLNNLFEAQYNLGEKFYDLRNTNAFIRWAKENPVKFKALGTVGAGSIGLPILNKIFGN